VRPVDRGPAPSQPFARYQDAKGPLIERLEEYCSYCETRVNAGLQVEHLLAKAANPVTLKDWNNFLLSCVNCNSTKGTKSTIVQGAYYWPHLDNSARAFEYSEDGRVTPHRALSPQQQAVASATLALTGLDRVPPNASPFDYRWFHRREAFEIAEEARRDLQTAATPVLREWIVTVATSVGHWSIWMTVFAADPYMRRRLISAFVGTSANCFNANAGPVLRPGGAL
jgi:uncharacterized protein (TIGR02646 family)